MKIPTVPIAFAALALTLAVAPARAAVDDTALATQVRLARAGFSPGEIDGAWGHNTRGALTAFQATHGLPPTGELDPATEQALPGGDPIGTYTIGPADVGGPFVPGPLPDDMMELAKLPALSYTSPLEELAERLHTDPALLQTLNPQATFAPGETIRVPALGAPAAPAAQAPAANGAPEPPDGVPADVTVVVDASESALAVRSGDRVLFWAPVTAGSDHDPLPLGNWKVTGVQRDPTFRYNPDLFWDAEPTHTKAMIPAGPNNPVGVVWIDLDKPHYGIHGSSEPGQIGHTYSHGCVRLTNWDALRVASMVKPGTPVVFQP